MKTENAQLADGFWKKKQVMHNVLFMINFFLDFKVTEDLST
jgi:hypothetical protein